MSCYINEIFTARYIKMCYNLHVWYEHEIYTSHYINEIWTSRCIKEIYTSCYIKLCFYICMCYVHKRSTRHVTSKFVSRSRSLSPPLCFPPPILSFYFSITSRSWPISPVLDPMLSCKWPRKELRRTKEDRGGQRREGKGGGSQFNTLRLKKFITRRRVREKFLDGIHSFAWRTVFHGMLRLKKYLLSRSKFHGEHGEWNATDFFENATSPKITKSIDSNFSVWV